MTDNIEWRSLDVTMAEGMTLRVGSFRASDGEVVTFAPDALRKIFSRVSTPLPMYDTHKGANTNQPRKVFGHAVKIGLETTGDHICYKALMMDPSFKLAYASGSDDTSAEIDPIRDEAGNIIDGTLTGIAVVPNPAISGTQMKVGAVAFEAPTVTLELPAAPVIQSSSGGFDMTKGIEKALLEAGVPADKVGSIVDGARAHFSKEFEHDGLQKRFEDVSKQVELACSERDSFKKKFEDASAELDTIYGGQVTALVNDIKGLKFENPEAIVDGMTNGQKIKTLSTLKESLVKAIPASASVGNPIVSAQPAAPGGMKFEDMLKEMGVEQMWNDTHKAPVVK